MYMYQFVLLDLEAPSPHNRTTIGPPRPPEYLRWMQLTVAIYIFLARQEPDPSEFFVLGIRPIDMLPEIGDKPGPFPKQFMDWKWSEKEKRLFMSEETEAILV